MGTRSVKLRLVSGCFGSKGKRMGAGPGRNNQRNQEFSLRLIWRPGFGINPDRQSPSRAARTIAALKFFASSSATGTILPSPLGPCPCIRR